MNHGKWGVFFREYIRLLRWLRSKSPVKASFDARRVPVVEVRTRRAASHGMARIQPTTTTIYSMTTSPAEKIEKIARLAFDPAAAEGESVNAATMLVQIARKHKIGFGEFKLILGASARLPNSVGIASTIVPFGKHKGQSIAQIYQQNPGYLDWLLREVAGHKALKQQITAFLKANQN